VAALLRAVDDQDMPASVGDDAVMIAGRYEIVGRIGRGATGSVYRAYDHTLIRHVAIKLLKPGELAVAEREAQVLARVTHRNVVTIHDYGQSGGHRYLVLELLEGRDFREWLRERPSCHAIIDSFIEAGKGLSAAHRAGLVHRDFKPSNVILTNTGRVVVIDFGLARNLNSLCGEVGPQLGSEAFTEGTLAYMAPERLAGHDNDERSDQFSFCVAVWEALAGVNPFTGADPLARYRSIRNGPEAGKLDAPRHVIHALERGMSFDSGQRFASMDELIHELSRPVAVERRRRARPVLTAAAIAATFIFGWGVAPEGLTIDEAHSSLDPRADAAMSILESARKRAADGDNRTALKDLMYAADLITVATSPGEAEYCSFGSSLPDVADQMAAQGGMSEARMAYAVAVHFSTACPSLSKEELLARRESMRATSWIQDEQ
jgi:serine/threonine protein kinase